MDEYSDLEFHLPSELVKCIDFHGHLCPGLVYGYIVGREAKKILNISRAVDEEIVAICENDSCAVDALQVMLGTTAGKGNLIIHNYGKNAYTIIQRDAEKAYRFSKKDFYQYKGDEQAEFQALENVMNDNTASEDQICRYRLLKARDLVTKPFEDVFETTALSDFQIPPEAPMAQSEKCSKCGELTMSTRLIAGDDNRLYCTPCHLEEKESES